MIDNTSVARLAPRENPILIGHEAVERQLVRVFRSGRMHHAWLITGPAGIGKATLAYRLARWILAGAPAGPEEAGLHLDPDHPVFRMVASGGHADLRVLEREIKESTGKLRAEISVAQVRDVIRFLQLTPAMGGWRIVIVDTVDDLNATSANALLKVLEEPPARGLFLLVNHAISLALPTVRSRCQRLVLQPLTEHAVARLAARMLPSLPPEEITALTRLADGSPGRALALVEAGGLGLLHEMESVLAGLPRFDELALDRHTEKVARAGDEAMAVLRDLLLWWIAARVRSGLAEAGTRPAGLDRWARLWENTRRLFERAEAASLDRKQALLEIFYDIQSTACAT